MTIVQQTWWRGNERKGRIGSLQPKRQTPGLCWQGRPTGVFLRDESEQQPPKKPVQSDRSNREASTAVESAKRDYSEFANYGEHELKRQSSLNGRGTRRTPSISRRTADRWCEWYAVEAGLKPTSHQRQRPTETLPQVPREARSTHEQHRLILHDYIRPRWGKTYVDEVRVLELKQWFIAIAKRRNLAAQSVQKIKQVFRRLYAYGYENELIAANLNPVRACNIRGVGTKSKSKVIVVPPEIAWQIAMELPIMSRTLVLLAAATGLRTSELLGLRWGDIDWEKQTIHLNRTWLGYVGDGKTPESREPAAMGARMTEFLRTWHRETPYAEDTDWIFPSFRLRGKNPISGSQFVKDHIRPRFIKHGIIDAAYRGRAGLHAFRHSLATVLITEEQVDPKTAQGILRHANSDVTMQIYTHAQDEAKRKALDKFEARLVQ